MRHLFLTCKHHPELRWMCKEIAYTPGYGYNGARNIFFEGWFDPNATNDAWRYRSNIPGKGSARECACPPTDLILAPEEG